MPPLKVTTNVIVSKKQTNISGADDEKLRYRHRWATQRKSTYSLKMQDCIEKEQMEGDGCTEQVHINL